MKKYLAMVFLFSASVLYGQPDNSLQSREIIFPDIEGYRTLKCDLHMHTVFSDGSVWPDIRVREAQKDDLDAIAITDHIEYQPHKDDIPHLDRNRPFQVATETAGDNLIVINGSEITRDMPPGHANAIFLQDANKLLVEEPYQAYQEAGKQNAFTFWNHPHWTSQYSDGVAQITDLHKKLIKEGLLHGIEVVNDLTYSDEAIQIALDYDLTFIGTSDIHGIVDWRYEIPEGGHRPVTLVFAKEKSQQSLREALFAKRTVVYFRHTLIGRTDWLNLLISKSIECEKARYAKETSVLEVVLRNRSSCPITLANQSEYTLHRSSGLVIVKPLGTEMIYVKTLEHKKEVSLTFDVLNAVHAPHKHPQLSMIVKPQE